MQWGFLSTEADNIAFPMPFKSTNYMFLSKIYGPASGGADLVAYNYFTRLQTGVTYEYSYTRNWIAIGQQQWGFHNGSGNNIITLLLPYKSCYTPLASSTDTYSGNLPYVLPVGSRQNAALSKLDISSAASSCYWLTIGYQQWGYVHQSGNDNQTLNLPIAFNFAAYSVAIATYNSGNHASCKGFTKSTITLNAGEAPNVEDCIGYFILGIQSSGVQGKVLILPLKDIILGNSFIQHHILLLFCPYQLLVLDRPQSLERIIVIQLH